MKESGERTDRSTSGRTFRLISYSALFLELLCAPDLLVQEALPFGGFCKACVCAGWGWGSGNMWPQQEVGVHREGQSGQR